MYQIPYTIYHPLHNINYIPCNYMDPLGSQTQHGRLSGGTGQLGVNVVVLLLGSIPDLCLVKIPGNYHSKYICIYIIRYKYIYRDVYTCTVCIYTSTHMYACTYIYTCVQTDIYMSKDILYIYIYIYRERETQRSAQFLALKALARALAPFLAKGS